MYFLMGTGNGYEHIYCEYFLSEDKGEYVSRPYYTYLDYEAGETGLPGYGLYYKFTPAKAGTLKITVWVNKGNRKTFVVKGSTGVPLTPYVDYVCDGYVNGQNSNTDQPKIDEETGEQAVDNEGNPVWIQHPTYFTADEMPNGVVFLPSPPDTTSILFISDYAQYMWGKTIRNTERGQEAIDHVVTSVSEMAALFSKPFGMTISREATPAIYKMLLKAIPTLRLSAVHPKETYMRKRPYVRMNETTPVPQEEEELRNSGSYPSGHAIRGWGMALLLAEINPAAQDALLKLGYEWGESRVILGYHWQTDVDAAITLASASYARLHTSQEFLDDMAKAREEYARLSKNQAH